MLTARVADVQNKIPSSSRFQDAQLLKQDFAELASSRLARLKVRLCERLCCLNLARLPTQDFAGDGLCQSIEIPHSTLVTLKIRMSKKFNGQIFYALF